MMEQQENTKAQATTNADHEKVVKNEPEPDGEESEAEPDFLDDLLQSAADIAAAVAENSSGNRVKSEPNTNNTNEDAEHIDPSFFDELLVRSENDRKPILPTRNQPRIKRERIELEDGEVSNDEKDSASVEKKSKNKKSKKSKRKKSRESPVKIKSEKVDSSVTSPAAATSENNRPRLQVRAEFRSFQAASPSPPPPEESDEPQTPIETHIGGTNVYQPIPYQLSASQNEVMDQKPEKELTSEEKLCRALERIMYAKRAFQKAKQQKEKQFYPNDPVFAYTPTVRKLPTSFSYFTQQIYDNRSPLHTVNNVTFQFNSMATRLDLQEWGLESLPPKSRTVARILSYDVDSLFAKRQSIKIPDKIQKSNQSTTTTEDKELCEPSNSTLFVNVLVQTDDVKVIPSRRRGFYRDVGLQSTPSTNVMGTQTNPAYTGQGMDLPLFNVIRNLNENQLEALDDFVQFILEPTGSSGIDVYQQRKRLADIYKISQIPAEPSRPTKRSANDAGLSERMPSPPPPPSIHMPNDYIKREPDTYHYPTERRKQQAPPPPFRRNVHSQPVNRYSDELDDIPAPSAKYYGRGGMRR